jgi:hypothetical protein
MHISFKEPWRSPGSNVSTSPAHSYNYIISAVLKDVWSDLIKYNQPWTTFLHLDLGNPWLLESGVRSCFTSNVSDFLALGVIGHSSEFMELNYIVQNNKNYNLNQGNMSLLLKSAERIINSSFLINRLCTQIYASGQRVNKFKW